MAARHWNQLSRDVLMTPSLTEVKKCLDNTLRHTLWFLRKFCEGPGIGLEDPCGSIPTQDNLWFYEHKILWTTFTTNLFIRHNYLMTQPHFLPKLWLSRNSSHTNHDTVHRFYSVSFRGLLDIRSLLPFKAMRILVSFVTIKRSIGHSNNLLNRDPLFFLIY